MTQPSSDQSDKLLLQISRTIRATLDIDTIWQQAVNSLGQYLGVSRCIICPYKGASLTVPVVAEYRIEPYSSMLGLELPLSYEPDLWGALASLEPIIVDQVQRDPIAPGFYKKDQFQRQSILAIASRYQDQPNALIILHQCDRTRQWSTAEIEFVREIADQVGCAIAHVTIYQELREARKQAKEAYQIRSQFLSMISDQLRNPLNGIIGSLKLILDEIVEEPEEQIEFIKTAHGSAIHLLKLITDFDEILNFTKLKESKLQIELTSVNLNTLLKEVERYTLPQVLVQNLYFSLKIPENNGNIILSSNYRMLLQVMLNVVGNAIKFTHKGGVTIAVEVREKKGWRAGKKRPNMVEICVTDTGIGIPVEYQPRLFEPFFRVHDPRTSPYPGTGIGLAISKKLVEAMGGGLNFYSMGEKLGSTVTVTLPLYQEQLMRSSVASTDSIELFS